MIINQFLLTCLLFSTIYPLSYWIKSSAPPQYPFHKYHLRLTSLPAGLAVISILFFGISWQSKVLLIIWKISLLTICHRYWKHPKINHKVILIPFVLGLGAFSLIYTEVVGRSLSSLVFTILGGSILCISIFTVHLCVWNHIRKENSFAHLQKTIAIYEALLTIRLIRDSYTLIMSRVVSLEQSQSLGLYLLKQQIMLPYLAILLATILPLASLWFMKNRVENNSYLWALGFLTPVLIATIAGEILYKITLFKYGIPL